MTSALTPDNIAYLSCALSDSHSLGSLRVHPNDIEEGLGESGERDVRPDFKRISRSDVTDLCSRIKRVAPSAYPQPFYP